MFSIGCTRTYIEPRVTLQSEAPMCVATYNIRHGVGMDGKLNLSRTLKTIEGLNADIIALQEVDQLATRSGQVDQVAWLASRMNMYSAFGAFMDFQGGQYGLAILSRYPIHSSEEWRLTDGNEPRVALAANVILPDGQVFTAVAVHFDWVSDDAFRFTQASETARLLKQLATPWIVFGDFNDTPGSRTMDQFYSIGSGIRPPTGDLFSFPADLPEIEIDSIIAGPPQQWIVNEGTVIEDSATSDHRPVTAILRLKKTD